MDYKKKSFFLLEMTLFFLTRSYNFIVVISCLRNSILGLQFSQKIVSLPCCLCRSNLAASTVLHVLICLFYSCASRILMMMQTVASHKAENRMGSSAVSACMAPLLLRPLLAGDCELENDFDVGGDGSVQLLQAAAAANHAQAIVITLLEEYNSLFGVSSNDIYLFLCTFFFSLFLYLSIFLVQLHLKTFLSYKCIIFFRSSIVCIILFVI